MAVWITYCTPFHTTGLFVCLFVCLSNFTLTDTFTTIRNALKVTHSCALISNSYNKTNKCTNVLLFVLLCCFMLFYVLFVFVLFYVLFVFMLFYVLFVCKYVPYYCHRVLTQLQLTNISYHIISYIISYHIISYIISYHISYHINIIYRIISYHI